MIVNLKSIAGALSKAIDLANTNKQALNIMLDISDKEVRLNFTDGNNIFTEKLEATLEEGDIRDRIAFDFRRLNSVIEACKPTGKIITDDIQIIFGANNTCIIRAEKKIVVDDKGNTKVASVVDQQVGWTPMGGNLRVAVLERANYDALLHIPDMEWTEGCKSIKQSEWEDIRETWDTVELKNLLAKLSIENGKTVYVAPKAHKGFVNNTDCVICIPFTPDITNKIVQTSSMAKAMASMLSKVEADTIYVHVLEGKNLVYSTEDNKVAFMIKNFDQNNNEVKQVNNAIQQNYSDHFINFNREVLMSCVSGAKISSESEKIVLEFVQTEEGCGLKMVMKAKNTNKSIDNTYDIAAEYVLGLENILGTQLNVTLNLLNQAVSNINSEYVAFDIAPNDSGKKMVRIAEIDLERRAKINEAYNIDGGWTPEFSNEHRAEMLGYTTYFQVGAD